MRQVCIALLLIVAIGGMAAQRPARRKAGQPRGPDLAVLAIKIQREPRLVAVEGALRNTSDRPLRGVTLYFVFLESGGQTITRKNVVVTEGAIEPGDEGSFLGQTTDPVRAVWVRLEAADKDGRHLTVDKPGPYAIE